MANTDFIDLGQLQASINTNVIEAKSGETLEVSNNSFVSDADISRDGQDLVLELENGETLVIEGYFAVENPPLLVSENGSALTPQLVESFAHNPQFAQAGGMTDESPVGGVLEVSGNATVTRTDGTVEEITLGTPIYQGDIIETEGDGAVNIRFVDETEFAVSEDARLAIDEYVFDPETSEGTTNFSVLRGVFVFTSGLIGRDDPDDVEIETPAGSIGIRGTIIAGKIDPEGGDHQITVIEGAIVIRNALGEATLSNQFETVQLGGYNSEIVNIGQIDAGQMNKAFGSVGGVSPSLFSAINDTANDQGQDDNAQNDVEADASEDVSEDGDTEGDIDAQGETEGGEAPTLGNEGPLDGPEAVDAPEGEGPALDAEGQPVEGEGPAPAEGEAPIGPDGEPVEGPDASLGPDTATGLEAGLGGPDASGLGTQGTGPAPGTGAAIINTIATGLGNTAGSPDIAGTGPAAGNLPPLSVTLPPPNVTNGDDGSAATDDGSAPVVSGPIILDLNALSSTRGYKVPGLPGGIEAGISVAAIGDVDGNGFADFAFTSNDGIIRYVKNAASGVAAVDNHSISSIAGDISEVDIHSGGDLDADGNLDVIIGASIANAMAQPFSGQIGVFDSTVPSAINTITADVDSIVQTNAAIGDQVTMIGDINGDGFSDYAFAYLDSGGGPDGHVAIVNGKPTSLTETIGDAGDYTLFSGPLGSSIQSVAAAGDVNNDGFDDLIMTDNGNQARLIFGGTGAPGSLPIGGPGGTTDFAEHVAAGGDINGDGYNDLLISSVNTGSLSEQVHLYLGNASSPSLNATLFTSRAGWDVTHADFIGDFNGDGIEDFSVTTSDGLGGNDIFVVFGRTGGISADIDLNFADLTSIPNGFGFAMVWDGHDDVEVTGIGDANGDGLYDIAVSSPDANGGSGEINVVYGKATPDVITDGSVGDADSDAGEIDVAVNNSSVVGTSGDDVVSTETGGGVTARGVSISTGAGDDVIALHTLDGATPITHRTIDGGLGHDTLNIYNDTGVLDFAGVDQMSVSGIEHFVLKGDSQNFKLSTANLFQLLRESDSNELRISFDGPTAGSSNFVIEDPTASGADPTAIGFVENAPAGGYREFQFEGYKLFIDTDLGLEGQVVV